MRTALIVAAAVITLAAIWIFGGRQIVLVLDALATADHAPPVSAPDVISSPGFLNVAGIPLELSRANEPLAEIRTAGTRVMLHVTVGRDFELGTVGRQGDGAGPYDVPVFPDPGDTVTFAITHSVTGWPTPLELNFMTGKSPSSKRNVYYTLTWKKQNGAELEMVWRYEQWFYDDWASATMINEGATGLISIRTRDAER